MSEINITPFTDVLLVLLVIFMILAAMVVPPGFERRLGPSGGRVSPAQVHRIPVVITAAGVIAVDGTATSVSGLYAQMARLAIRNPRTKLSLTADTHARYALIIRVLDAAKQSGLTDISFVTE